MQAATVVRELPRKYGIKVQVYSNDHPPPHIHVLTDRGKTRYLWPERTPYPEDEPLPEQFRQRL